MIHASRTLLLVMLYPALAVNAQLNNGGFESTSVLGEDTIPDNWSVNSGFGGGAIHEGNSGDWSLGVWNWYWYGPGIAANGTNALDGHDGLPFTGTPLALSGFYKRHAGELDADQTSNDSAQVTILLTRWNAGLFRRDTVAFGSRAFGEEPAWSSFSVDFNYLLNGEPDTLIVQALSGVDCFCGMGTNGTCCYFYLDDLALEMQNGILSSLDGTHVVSVAAVGDGSVEIMVRDAAMLPMTLRLYDALGRSFGARTIQADRERLRIPASVGVLGYSLSHAGHMVASGKLVVW